MKESLNTQSQQSGSQSQPKLGTLFVVATPIGNLGDITVRALEVLGSVDLIAAEDSRVTYRLLSHYNIQKKIVTFNAHATQKVIESLINNLKQGLSIALVTDAGTPAISDPGSLLVNLVKEQQAGKIVPIPGPSALTAAYSASGILGGNFTFYGFLPHKKGRETLFKEISASQRVSVFYESPHRILKTLESLQKHAPNMKLVIARELTKIYEEFVDGTASEILLFFTQKPEKVRGEFVVLCLPQGTV